MSKTEAIINHDEHQELMTQLQLAVDKINDCIADANEAVEALSDHNTDITAHPDLRTLIEEAAGAASQDAVDERIQQHNESPTAHPELRNMIKTALEDTSNVRPLIDELIIQHNIAEDAHPNITSAISNIKLQIGDLNLTDIEHEINEIQTAIGIGDGNDDKESINDQILALQTKDAQHDTLIAQNSDSIKSLSTRTNNLSENVTYLTANVTTSLNNSDASNLRIHNLDREEVLGYTQQDDNGPNLVGLKCNIPTYVKKNGTTTFVISGITLTHGGQDPIINFENGLGDFTLEPMENYLQGNVITMHVGNIGNEGDILDFTVRIKDPTTEVEVQRVFSTMIARSISEGSLSVAGLKTNCEPGAKVTFRILNNQDDGSGRFTYAIDSLQSNIAFSKVENIGLAEEITATIPTDAIRESVLQFKIISKDSLSSDTFLTMNIYINPLPDVNNFKHNIPSLVAPGKTYIFKMYGITSVNGMNATYSINNNGTHSKVRFDKTNDILTNENVKMIVDETAERGEVYSFDVITMDENGASVTIKIEFSVNLLPEAATITTNLPESSLGGRQITFQISGGSDSIQTNANRDDTTSNIRYAIDMTESNMTVSKTENILPSDNVVLTLPKVAEEITRTFKIYSVDELDERSATPKEISILIQPVYLPKTPTITSPANGTMNLPYTGFTMTWTQFEYIIDTVSTKSE